MGRPVSDSKPSTEPASDPRSDIMDALDMPEELIDVQTAYMQARREWQYLDGAYRSVVEDVLKRLRDGK